MIRRPPRSTQSRSSAASDVYKRQNKDQPSASARVPVPATLTLAAVRHFYWVGSPFIKATALTTASRVANGPGATSTTSRAVISPSFFEQQNARQCQTNANQTAKCAKRIASGCQLTPLGQRGGAVLLEDVASAEVAIVVKVIVDRGVDGGEFLQGLDVPEFRHCPFPSSERLV